MRQYANPSQSGTIASTVGRKDTIDNVVDRVMMIAQRLVKLEKTVENQNLRIEKLQEELKAAKATKPAATRTTKTTKTETTK
jgi:hypothetical protein